MSDDIQYPIARLPGLLEDNEDSGPHTNESGSLMIGSGSEISPGNAGVDGDTIMDDSQLQSTSTTGTQKEEVDKSENTSNGSPTPKKPNTRAQTRVRKEREKEYRAAVNRVLKCNPQHYYQILDVPETADTSQIRKAYKKLAILTHPDKNKDQDSVTVFKSKYSPLLSLFSQPTND